MIRRINFVGGPGCGKSTNAANLFALMKGTYSVELVTEYVKSWAYESRQIYPYDQIYFFGKQMNREYTVLEKGKVDTIITDSPLLLQVAYAERAGLPKQTIDSMLTILEEYEKQYPSIYIYLNRSGKDYIDEGRYENLQQAKEMDELIASMMEREDLNYWDIDWDKCDIMYGLVEKELGDD